MTDTRILQQPEPVLRAWESGQRQPPAAEGIAFILPQQSQRRAFQGPPHRKSSSTVNAFVSRPRPGSSGRIYGQNDCVLCPLFHIEMSLYWQKKLGLLAWWVPLILPKFGRQRLMGSCEVIALLFYNCAHLKNKTKEEGRFVSSHNSPKHTGTRARKGGESAIS